MKEVVSTKKAPKAIGPYSQAIKTGDLIFVSGQLGIDPETSEFVSDKADMQAKQALNNIKNILESSGSSMEKIVKATIYLKDLNDYAAINKVYESFFTKDYPARVAVEVSKLPKNGLVEISVIAEV